MFNLNIHPIFIHFPVALLTMYALLELVRFRSVMAQPYWFYVKAMFAITGSLATIVALVTGDMAESIVTRTNPSLRPLIETHSDWAVITTTIFAVLAFVYLVEWIQRHSKFFFRNKFLIAAWRFCLWAKNSIMMSYVLVPLAVAGLISVTITGSLGGAIAYGPNIDPVVHFVYHLFF